MSEVVTVSLNDLRTGNIPQQDLVRAFGPTSLGILLVRDLPKEYTALRAQVLTSSSHLAALPSKTLESLTNPSSKYLVGWSHGVETLKPGVVDTAKGSYYINCVSATGIGDKKESANGTKHQGFEEYTTPNVWPDETAEPTMKGFRKDTEELIRLIVNVAGLVARACDIFAREHVDGYKTGGFSLEDMVRSSETSKARLLHYFPAQSKPIVNGHSDSTSAVVNDVANDKDEAQDSWCATHLDHGCLTGLTSAQYLQLSSSTPHTEISSPSSTAGLYIVDRQGLPHKISIPRDCLAFQTGEALELITRGKFKAVPHFVRGVDPDEEGCKGMQVARNTLAVFTQPNLDVVVSNEGGREITFGQFARGVVGRNTAG